MRALSDLSTTQIVGDRFASDHARIEHYRHQFKRRLGQTFTGRDNLIHELVVAVADMTKGGLTAEEFDRRVINHMEFLNRKD